MDEIKSIDEYINEEGKKVRIYKYKKMTVKVIYNNEPSEEALNNLFDFVIQNFNKENNKLNWPHRR